VRGLINGDDIPEMKRRLDIFPSDLEEYFDLMIRNIEPIYREDTVRFFETAMSALQTLPLFAYRFLEKEQCDKDYALESSIQAYDDSKIESICRNMKTRLNARCRDLLEVIEDNSEFTCTLFKYKVDFLHRAVRDFFLNTDAIKNLARENPNFQFDVRLSLCKIMVVLNKALPMKKDDHRNITRMLSLSDELMFHAREIELYSDETEGERRLLQQASLLDELDRVNIEHTKWLGFHWSNLRDNPKGSYMEYNQKTFIACAIQFKLTKYIRRRTNDKETHRKRGRPLLDYALRPKMLVSLELPDHQAWPDYEIVSFLLDQGLDPNQSVFIYDNQTIWSLFLQECYSTARIRYPSPSDDEVRDFYSIVDFLIKKGADPNLTFKVEGDYLIDITEALQSYFTKSDINTLDELLIQKRKNIPRFWKLFRF
jgi:hypothetical protein